MQPQISHTASEGVFAAAPATQSPHGACRTTGMSSDSAAALAAQCCQTSLVVHATSVHSCHLPRPAGPLPRIKATQTTAGRPTWWYICCLFTSSGFGFTAQSDRHDPAAGSLTACSIWAGLSMHPIPCAAAALAMVAPAGPHFPLWGNFFRM